MTVHILSRKGGFKEKLKLQGWIKFSHEYNKQKRNNKKKHKTQAPRQAIKRKISQ